ncbi:unnamed protein product, partial [Ectocarpus sp. 8 AP-2014]
MHWKTTRLTGIAFSGLNPWRKCFRGEVTSRPALELPKSTRAPGLGGWLHGQGRPDLLPHRQQARAACSLQQLGVHRRLPRRLGHAAGLGCRHRGVGPRGDHHHLREVHGGRPTDGIHEH